MVASPPAICSQNCSQGVNKSLSAGGAEGEYPAIDAIDVPSVRSVRAVAKKSGKVKGPGHASCSRSIMLLSIVSVTAVQGSYVPLGEGCQKQGESENHGMLSCCSADLRCKPSTTTSSIIRTAEAANIADHPVAASFTCLGPVDEDCYFVDCSKSSCSCSRSPHAR